MIGIHLGSPVAGVVLLLKRMEDLLVLMACPDQLQ